VGSEGTYGMVTYDSETFRLDNLESGVAGGACGGPDSLCPFSPQIKPKHLLTSQSTFKRSRLIYLLGLHRKAHSGGLLIPTRAN